MKIYLVISEEHFVGQVVTVKVEAAYTTEEAAFIAMNEIRREYNNPSHTFSVETVELHELKENP